MYNVYLEVFFFLLNIMIYIQITFFSPVICVFDARVQFLFLINYNRGGNSLLSFLRVLRCRKISYPIYKQNE